MVMAALWFVLLSIPFVACRDDFLCAKLVARSYVGQVGNLRRVGNPPPEACRRAAKAPIDNRRAG